MATYRVGISEDALEDLRNIQDQRTVKALRSKIRELATEPGVRGKALKNDLFGFRSVRAAGQRYRIIYEV